MNYGFWLKNNIYDSYSLCLWKNANPKKDYSIDSSSLIIPIDKKQLLLSDYN